MVREQACQRALTERRAVWGDDALERGHGAPLERTAQLGDALSGVGAVAITIDAAELVEGQAATGRRRSECQWALTQKRTPLGSGALEVGDHSLLEDGRECRGALDSDAVAPDTARDGWGHTE